MKKRSTRSRPRTRLFLQNLEDRWVPSTFTVHNTLDDGSVGSLRWAVGQANTHSGADTIGFDSGVFSTPRTITLSGGQLELSDTTGAISIAGPKAGVTVRGGGDTRVFQVDALVTASIAEMTITNGFAGNGGGLSNSGSLTMTNCIVSGNRDSDFAGRGGGLYNSGSLTLTNCTVSGNVVGSDYGGNGFGGGVANSGTATLTNCTVSGNSSRTYRGPDRGSGLSNSGSLAQTNCTVLGNCTGYEHEGNGFGGSLYNSGSLTLTNSTVSGNSAYGTPSYLYYNGYGCGGGVVNSGTATLTNCTVSGNYSPGVGGIYTISALNATNTIVAGNQGYFGADVVGSLTTNLNNLINMSAAAAGLGTLGNYGGPTQTIPLLPGSPAINAGISAGAPLTDQRGLPRFGAVDIGAFEVQAAPTILSTVINDGSAQRSRVARVTVMFDSAVSFASSAANGFTL